MKIGIVTLWSTSDNYGGILQTFALQRYLRDKGHDAFIIRYGHKHTLIQKLRTWLSSFIKELLIMFGVLDKRREVAFQEWKKEKEWDLKRNFNVFRNTYIALSAEQYETLNDIKHNPPEADIYITGSDQMWSKDVRDTFQQIKYLNFGDNNVRRVAYAVSFGHHVFPCVDVELFRRLLSRFEKISMREESGVSILKEMGIESVRCCDSTLLLHKDCYLSLMSRRKHIDKYAYIYTVNVTTPDEIYWNELKELIRNNNMKAVVTTASGYKKAEELLDNCIYDYASVEEWLANIYYSDIVITASFHGIVFSLLFKKDFIYVPLKGKYGSGNDRIIELLDCVGLSGRMATAKSDLSFLFNNRINYDIIKDDNLLQLINFSREFLELNKSN